MSNDMQSEPISFRTVFVRIPETMAKEIETAMHVAGIMKISDFTRQALVLRVREIQQTAQVRGFAAKPVHFSRRTRAKKEAA